MIVGAAIATKVVHPALAIPLAFGSHFILDILPHWNPHLNTETKKFGKPTKKSTILVIVDTLFSLGIGFFIASRSLPDINKAFIILLCCLTAALPDIIEGPYFFLNMRNKYIERWIAFQKSLQNNASAFWGLTTQIIIVAASLCWILS